MNLKNAVALSTLLSTGCVETLEHLGPKSAPPEAVGQEIDKLQTLFSDTVASATDRALTDEEDDLLRSLASKRRRVAESVGCVDNSHWEAMRNDLYDLDEGYTAVLRTDILCRKNPDLSELYTPYVGFVPVEISDVLSQSEMDEVNDMEERFRESCLDGFGRSFFSTSLSDLSMERSIFFAERELDDRPSVWVCLAPDTDGAGNELSPAATEITTKVLR